MASIVYVTPADDLLTGVKAAFDIYAASGMVPKVISDGFTTVRFDSRDASAVVYGKIMIENYVSKHRID